MINLGKISKNGKEIILIEKENGCLECISHCKDTCGYTRVFVNNKHQRLFRYLYEKENGKIEKGKVIRHICDNPSCCNINHLEIGTQYDNVQDMIKRGRDKYKNNGENIRKNFSGEKNWLHKLNRNEVKEIYLSRDNAINLSKKYNISKSNVYMIKKKETWKWFTDALDKFKNI